MRGEKVLSPEVPQAARRRLGSPVLWGFVQAFLAAGFYFSLGLVADRAHGYTWLVYLVAALFFVLTALSYVEGASLHQERGGVTILARYAFNELWSFIAGWAIMLDYLLLIALTALAVSNHLGVLWNPLGDGVTGFLVSVVVIGAVALINLRGIDPRRFERFFFFALADLGVQVVLLVIGLIVLYDPKVLSAPSQIAGGVSFEDLVFAFTLAVVAFTALDASSGFAGQVAVGRRGLKRLMLVRFLTLIVAYVGLSLVAASVPEAAAGAREAPVIGVIDRIDQNAVRDFLRVVVAISATLVLFTSCVGAMLGLSRLGYALAVNRQIPSAVGRLHPTYRTPVVLIVLGAVLAVALVLPDDPKMLGALYAFGATLAFTLVHVSVLALRKREPDRDRPYRVPFNVTVGGISFPLPTVVGALLSMGAFVSVLILHDSARIVGPAWLLVGILLYVSYRTSSEKPITKRLTVPESTLTRTEVHGAEYGSILVPVFGSPLDDDIMQTAGRLAAEERPDEEEEGAQIEAIWVFEIPMSLPLDGRLGDGELKRARKALARAKAVGEEYEGVEVSPFTVRARSAGAAIVREARRRGVEAIVMPAEEPSLVRGGVLLGGKEGLRGTFVGETTRYVVTKAPCRVILTAPPDPKGRIRRPKHPMLAHGPNGERPGAPPPDGDPMRPMRRAAERLRRRGVPAGDGAGISARPPLNGPAGDDRHEAPRSDLT
jgi:basic amino acid/polyamine antiporter, APA family